MKRRKFSRREFLKGVGAAGLGMVAASCGTPAPSTSTSPTAGPTSVPATTAPGTTAVPTTIAERKKILFWYNADNHKTEYEARVAELNEKFNIDFQMELLAGDAQVKKLQATLMAGDGFPDIIEMNAGDIVKFLKGEDRVIPFFALNEVLKESPYFDQVLKSRWDRYTKDGNLYGAPHDVHPIVLLYHETAWQDIGVDLTQITTWDEFLAACQKVDPQMPDGSTRYAIMTDRSDSELATRLLQKGIWWTDPAGEPMLADPRFKEAVEDALRFRPYRVDTDWGNQVAMLKSGQVMSELVPDWLFGIHKQGTVQDTEFLAASPMRIMRVPGFSADDPRVGTWGGTAGAVPKMSPNRDLAIEVMLYLYFDNASGQLEERFKSTGIIPPVKSIWGDAAFHEPDAYLGGQVGGDIFIPAAEALPSYSENWTTSLANTAWREQAALLWTDEIDIDTAIQTADANARQQIEQNA
jgi:arabinosaccharide transport system substrate-binding protein